VVESGDNVDVTGPHGPGPRDTKGGPLPVSGRLGF
jgi:hypothetical protein